MLKLFIFTLDYIFLLVFLFWWLTFLLFVFVFDCKGIWDLFGHLEKGHIIYYLYYEIVCFSHFGLYVSDCEDIYIYFCYGLRPCFTAMFSIIVIFLW